MGWTCTSGLRHRLCCLFLLSPGEQAVPRKFSYLVTVQNKSAKLVGGMRARIQPFLQPSCCCMTPSCQPSVPGSEGTELAAGDGMRMGTESRCSGLCCSAMCWTVQEQAMLILAPCHIHGMMQWAAVGTFSPSLDSQSSSQNWPFCSSSPCPEVFSSGRAKLG